MTAELFSAIAMVGWLWIGMAIGRRRRKDAVLDQLRTAARSCMADNKWHGGHEFVTVHRSVLTVDGNDFIVALVEKRPGRELIVCQTQHVGDHHQHTDRG